MTALEIYYCDCTGECGDMLLCLHWIYIIVTALEIYYCDCTGDILL